MALRTLGTSSTTTLQALEWKRGAAIADVASIAANIKLPFNPAHPIAPGAFGAGGVLYFPQRKGFLVLAPNDYVAYDPQGWPIVVSWESIAGSGWTHS